MRRVILLFLYHLESLLQFHDRLSLVSQYTRCRKLNIKSGKIHRPHSHPLEIFKWVKFVLIKITVFNFLLNLHSWWLKHDVRERFLSEVTLTNSDLVGIDLNNIKMIKSNNFLFGCIKSCFDLITTFVVWIKTLIEWCNNCLSVTFLHSFQFFVFHFRQELLIARGT